jgi:hypothetical protein
MVVKTTTREKEGRAPARYLVANGGTEEAPGIFADLSDFTDAEWAALVASLDRLLAPYREHPAGEGGVTCR